MRQWLGKMACMLEFGDEKGGEKGDKEEDSEAEEKD